MEIPRYRMLDYGRLVDACLDHDVTKLEEKIAQLKDLILRMRGCNLTDPDDPLNREAGDALNELYTKLL